MIEVKAQKVKVYSSLLEETKEKILFNKDDKLFITPIFMELMEDEVITETLTEEVITAHTERELVDKVVDFYKEHHSGEIYKKTEETLKHWQYINGFTKQMYLGGSAI